MRCGHANLVTSPASVSSACLASNAASAGYGISSSRCGRVRRDPVAQLRERLQFTSTMRHGGLFSASAADTDLAAVSGAATDCTHSFAHVMPPVREQPVTAEVQEQLHLDLTGDTGFEEFKAAAQRGNVVPMHERIFSDHLTPVLAYRCLVRRDDRSAPSFLFEAVNNGTQQVNSLASNACSNGDMVHTPT